MSVLIVAYNHERYIAQALQGVLLQEVNFPYEIVVGDDCSTDSTRDILISFRDRFPGIIRLVLHPENLGLDGTRNLLRTLKACQGQYVAWLDGDDYWTCPHKLQKQADFLDTHPQCALCFHNVWDFCEDAPEERFLHNAGGQKKISTLEDLLEGCFAASCSLVFRRGLVGEWDDIVERAGLDDWTLETLLAQYGDIGYIDEVMAAHRMHRLGVWSRLSATEKLERMIQFYEQVRPILSVRYDETIQSHLLRCHYDLAIEHERQGELEKAATCLRKCVTTPSVGFEQYLALLGIVGARGKGMLRRRLWLCEHRVMYRLARLAQPILGFLSRVRIAGRTLARWALGKSVGSITARPNPIRLSSDHQNGLGVTTVSWASAKLESAEVHIGAPNGPLFSRSGPSGRKETGEWVRDGMLFYLQDVSGGLPLTRANTVATVTVSVTGDEAQASRSLM